ncbi:unnamed protein product (mitochondrion) [Plasmodiophora brassicae]|uniref:Translation initiation factor eIF2B subunit delta n=1 Tax=Plasmodiophora brassicae TaxID=37360 RepID=A0A3P3Y760_PLABS|nr:unnamed protein product [Plasmodiophora brassicae]
MATAELSAEEKKRLKEERRRQFLASRPDLEARPKPSRAERKKQQQQQQQQQPQEQQRQTPKQHPAKQASAQQDKGGKAERQSGLIATPKASPQSRAINGLLNHLPAYTKQSSQTMGIKMGAQISIHPSFVSLALAISKHILAGSNSRSAGLIAALRRFLNDYECPGGRPFSRHLEQLLTTHMKFLDKIRPLSVGMRNVAVTLKSAVSKLDPSLPNSEAKRILFEMLDKYTEERIVYALASIVKIAEDKIRDGDVILTFGRSHVIEEIVINAHRKGIKFRVIVADSGPQFEGRRAVQRLVRMCPALNCSYVLIQSVTYVMREVTKVFLSATSMFANGSVLGRIGTAVVAVMARTYHVPCIVCCETRNFSEKAQVDAITQNEHLDPDSLIMSANPSPLKDLQHLASLSVLNLAVPAVTREFMKSM